MKFDWYQATIDTSPIHAIEMLGKLGHEVRQNDKVGKMYRYQQGYEVHHHDKGVIARLAFGGNGNGVHAWATSDDSPAFADLLRTEWPEHHLVTRLDTAEDFNEAGSYERLRKVAKKVATDHRLKFTQYVDELNPMAGRTQYMGSNKSDYRGRLYEKGFEVIAKTSQRMFASQGLELNPANVITIRNESTGEDVIPANWTRLELQVRPADRAAKRLAAFATPEQAWTFTSWSQDLAKQALALDLERFYIRTKRISNDEQALHWMCSQYSNMLLRLRDDLGDFACVGLEIERIIQEQAKEKFNRH